MNITTPSTPLLSASEVAPTDSPPPAVEPKKRGRPVGWRMQLFVDQQSLTLEDFSFIRAVISGISTAEAFKRYYSHLYYDDHGLPALPHGLTMNARQDRLLEIIGVAVQTSTFTHLRPHFKSLAAPMAESQASEATTVQAHMSFQEWYETIDPDMYSERELPERYEEFLKDQGFGAEQVPKMTSVLQRSQQLEQKLSALGALQTELATLPYGKDPLSKWFAPSIQAVLKKADINTLDELIRHITSAGRKWARKVSGLSQTRAERIEAWLASHENTLPKVARHGSHWSAKPKLATTLGRLQRIGQEPHLLVEGVDGVHAAAVPALALRDGIAPLELLRVPAEIDGRTGTFRVDQPNHLGANDDMQAIRIWLGTFLNAGKLKTFDAYRREIERFYIWCIQEARVAVSSVSLSHSLGYQAFLRSIPPEYISVERVTRENPLWRPWRGQLDERSQKYALGVVSQFYNEAIRTGYLSGNPFASVRSAATKARVIDTSRSLSSQDLAWIREQILNLAPADSASTTSDNSVTIQSKFDYQAALSRRTQLILHLALSTGMRLQEMATAEFRRLRPARENDIEQDDQWMLTIVGKGKKERDIAISSKLRQAILSHHADARAALEQAGTAGALRLQSLDSHPPLLCALRSPVDSPSRLMDANAVMANDNIGLSATGIYSTLKTFIKASCKNGLKACQAQLKVVADSIRAAKAAQDIDKLATLEAQRDLLAREVATWERRSKISTHWMRHTFAKELLRVAPDGKGLKLAQQLLGHASISTTAIYLEQDETEKSRAARLVNPLGL